VLPLLAFQVAFQSYDFGYASAISVAVLAAIAGFAMVYIRFARFGKED
jgi:ABC-type sugar transport system permease subunit